MKLYSKIKKYRKKMGLSQAELAEMMEYSDKSMISKIENGKVDLSHSQIMKFADVLNVPADALMGFELSEAYYVASKDTKRAVNAVLGVRKECEKK